MSRGLENAYRRLYLAQIEEVPIDIAMKIAEFLECDHYNSLFKGYKEATDKYSQGEYEGKYGGMVSERANELVCCKCKQMFTTNNNEYSVIHKQYNEQPDDLGAENMKKYNEAVKADEAKKEADKQAALDAMTPQQKIADLEKKITANLLPANPQYEYYPTQFDELNRGFRDEINRIRAATGELVGAGCKTRKKRKTKRRKTKRKKSKRKKSRRKKSKRKKSRRKKSRR